MLPGRSFLTQVLAVLQRYQWNKYPAAISLPRWGETPSSRRPMKWDGIPHHTMLGKVSLSLIYCLSARTARRSLSPPRTRSTSSRKVISNNSVPLRTLKNRANGLNLIHCNCIRLLFDVVSKGSVEDLSSRLRTPDLAGDKSEEIRGN